MFAFLGLDYLTQHDFLKIFIHLPTNFIMSFMNTWVILHWVNVPHFLFVPQYREIYFFPLSCCYEKVWTWFNKFICDGMEHLLGVCLSVVYLDLEIDLFLVFWGTAILISILAIQIYTHTNNGGVFALSARTVTCVFDLGHSYRCKMESHSSFDLHFPGG